MASFGIKKCAAVFCRLLLRHKLVEIVARNPLQVIAKSRTPEHLLLAHSASSTPHIGARDSNGEGATSVSKSPGETADDLIFFDSSQQEVLGTSGALLELEEKTDSKEGNWRSQLSWLSNMMEPGLSMYKRSPPPDELAEKWDRSPSGRSLVDIVTTLLKSTAGMQQWGLSDITLGLYLLSLRHTADNSVDTIRGEQVVSDLLVQEWIYNLELAWGAYMKDAQMLARISMLREENVVKFVCNSSVMKPAYYIGIDPRHNLVIMSIRGTQTIHDVITDLSSDSEHAGRFDGQPVHYGSVEAARWILCHESRTLKKCLAANEGFGLLVIGHSLGGAAAALLGLMLRQDSQTLVGLSPEKIRVVGVGTPPCVSKALALRCREFTATLVLQDDVIPRISSSGLIQLRNEILSTNWNDVLKEGIERKVVVDLVAGTMQALSSVQDAARKYGALARQKINGAAGDEESSNDDLEMQKKELMQAVNPTRDFPELVAPGTLFHICSRSIKTPEFCRSVEGSGCSLWKGDENFYLGRIVLSSTMVSDHRIESYYYSLRDVLKGLPNSTKVSQF